MEWARGKEGNQSEESPGNKVILKKHKSVTNLVLSEVK